MCLFVGKMCATPCGKHKKVPLEDGENICKWHTEPGNDTEATDVITDRPTE
jgi:hypothetical protein